MIAEYLPENADIKVGDTLVADGGCFPPGIRSERSFR